MKLRWDDLRLFAAVCEHGSLSAAARALRLGQPTLSRRMGELEALVGEALLNRQVHGVSLTAAGQKLLPAAQHMAEWANEAQLCLRAKKQMPEGKVRIAAPPGIAFELLAPLAVQVRLRYPGLRFEVLSGIDTRHLGRGEADLSLRTSAPTDADLMCVDQVGGPMRVYVAPSYAATLPQQLGPGDLHWICWSAPHDRLRINQELEKWIPGFEPAFTSDDYLVQLAACQAGVGAMVMAKVLHRHSPLHQLQELDLDLGPQAVGTLYLVCHKRHRHLPLVQAAIDCIVDEFDRLRSGETASHGAEAL